MPITVPIRDLKDTGKISKLVHESDEPIVVTRNGYQDMVVMKPEVYRKLQIDREISMLHAAIGVAEKDLSCDKLMDAHAALDLVESRFDLYGMQDVVSG